MYQPNFTFPLKYFLLVLNVIVTIYQLLMSDKIALLSEVVTIVKRYSLT